ncbi:MAG: aromatic ring-hydroxylating dioxygenase subunit alpha [Gammaproteobacteria bacterium]|nr:aromatic ring-hydroxylating dioxygenase subunit alpha [Gammaproteobacteria bacterium]
MVPTKRHQGNVMNAQPELLNVSHKLPPASYYDPAWLDKERQQLFGNSWLFGGLETDVPDVGSYKTVKVGLSELVVVRDQEGALRAFHNTCRHRGAQLVQGSGKCKTLVCPYHKWGYGLDGQLRGVAQKNQYSDLNVAELGLHAASVDTWMGLIFVHADDNPQTSLADWLGGLKNELGIFQVDKLQELTRHTFTFPANWKLYIENHVDWLHLWYVHPETLGAFKHDQGERTQYGRHWSSFEQVKDEFRDTESGSDPLKAISHLEHQDPRYLGVGAHFIFPNLPVFTGRGFFATAELIPETPDKTTMDVRIYGVPGGDVDTFLAIFNEITKGEDVAIIESIQKNVRSPRYGVGPITHTLEKAISDFHDNYLALVD